MSISRQNPMVQEARINIKLLVFLASNHLMMELVKNLSKIGKSYSLMLLIFITDLLLARGEAIFFGLLTS
jgi:hypothetical protein